MTTTSLRRAFTIIELLVAVPLAALLFCGVAQTLVHHILVRTEVDDEIAAYARADRVWSILRDPLALCGYGMPKDPAGYAQAFPTSGATKDTFFSWPGPISITHSTVDKNKRENGSCRIVHAIPSKTTTTTEIVTSADRFTIELTGTPPHLEPTPFGSSPIWPKNWAIFGAMQPSARPFWFSAHNGPKQVTLRRAKPKSGDLETVTIPENDELYYLRATEARAGLHGEGDWAFYTDHHDGSGRQPRVVGVVDARFELAPTGRTMKMHLLIRGDHRHPEKITPGTPPGWPAEYAKDIPDAARHYRLYAFEMTFGLRNF